MDSELSISANIQSKVSLTFPRKNPIDRGERAHTPGLGVEVEYGAAPASPVFLQGFVLALKCVQFCILLCDVLVCFGVLKACSKLLIFI